MSGQITWEQVFALIALVTAMGGLWVRVENARGKIADELTAFKLEVTRNYVRSENLVDMERRVLGHIETLAESVNGLRKDVMQALSVRRRT